MREITECDMRTAHQTRKITHHSFQLASVSSHKGVQDCAAFMPSAILPAQTKMQHTVVTFSMGDCVHIKLGNHVHTVVIYYCYYDVDTSYMYVTISVGSIVYN